MIDDNSSKRKLKTVAIIQARMGSKRLPGKVVADIMGRPLLGHIIERIKISKILDEIIIATTDNIEDLPIIELASQYGIETYAGNVDDVLDRFYQAARYVSADIIVRITADDPFKDPVVLDKIAAYLIDHPELDYVSNTIKPTYPEGLDIEAFRFIALKKAYEEANLLSEREHVTPYIWKNRDKFNIYNICNEKDLSHLRWTIDYYDDLYFAREVYCRLYDKGIFLMNDVLNLLKSEPDLTMINSGIDRNLGYNVSLEKDKSIKIYDA